MAAGVDGYNFTLIDKRTIEYLQGLKKTVNVAKDYSWNNKLIGAELLQGVLGGESIPKIAGRLRNVEKKMEKSAVKNARTMTTAAQNRGRLDGMAQAQADGVIMQKMWVATHDGRTRDSHAEIDGEQQDQDDAFTNGLMFPADPAGEASEVYNCRCTMISVVKGFRSDDGTVFGVDTSLDDYTDEAQAYWGNKEQEAEQKAQKDEVFAVGVVREVKQKFVPAKTIQEAESVASQFVGAGGFGSVGLSYSGVDIVVANDINEALSVVYNVFDIPKLGGIAAPAKNTKLGKMINANAAYSPIRQSLLLDRNKSKTANGMLESLIADKKATEKVLANPELYDFNKLSITVRQTLEAAKISGRATVPETVKEAIWHEMGHHIERQITRAEFDALKQSIVECGASISGYATTSVSEYVAETTAAYLKGEKIKDKNMIAIFERLKRK